MVKHRKAYDSHSRYQYRSDLASRAKQSFTDECDINQIMAKYQHTGLLDHVVTYGGSYADMPSNLDFHESMNLITEAQELFQSLPSSIRTRFQNSPEAYLAFCSDDANADEMRSMGLLPPLAPAQQELPGIPHPDTVDPPAVANEPSEGS